MIKSIAAIFTIMVAYCGVFSEHGSQCVAKIRLIEGQAGLMRGGAGKPLIANVGMTLFTDDTIRSNEESLVEIQFDNGEIVRLDENTMFIIQNVSSQKAVSSLPVGRVWVNMKKIVSHRNFDVSTPTAVAAIRGTIYSMKASDDRSVDLSVYDGRVDVGPSENLKEELSRTKQKKAAGGDPVEIQGPSEVQGPHEVTLEQWHTIVAGMKIKIAPGGAFSTSKLEKIDSDTFVSENISLDRTMR